jgi:hypothetical protein
MFFHIQKFIKTNKNDLGLILFKAKNELYLGTIICFYIEKFSQFLNLKNLIAKIIIKN